MSESEQITPRDSETNLPLTGADDLVQALDARAPEREGLPRSYRMRADAHYVEQLGSPVQPVIRLLALGHIECRDLPPPNRVEALTRSIAAHGVLQPLIVRRHGARYTLIGGRKRLAAAMAANLGSVPCLVHDADGAAAAAIAAADNLRIDDPAVPSQAERNTSRLLLQALTSDLDTIQTSISLVRTPRGGLPHQVGADLIEAQTSRAAWLASCLLGAFDDRRLVPLSAIIQRVADGFEAHARLTGVGLDCSVTPSAGVWRLPEDAMTAVLNGGLFAMLSCLEGVPAPRLELTAEAAHMRTLKIEVLQRVVRVVPKPEIDFADRDLGRPEELIPALALRTARTVAAAYGGSAELSPLPGSGSVMRITFVNPQATA